MALGPRQSTEAPFLRSNLMAYFCHVSDYGIRSMARSELLQIVKTPARPRPVSRLLHQAALDRIVVHVVQLLPDLPVTPDVEVIKPPLPHPMVGMVVNGGRKSQPVQHPLTPGELRVVTQVLQDELGSAFFEPLHDFGKGWLIPRATAANGSARA